MPRFVVLHHLMPVDASRRSHWDLMLEEGDCLRTWALAAAPSPNETITAQALPAHRLCYLDYEGPISQGRGEVRRWDRGTFTWLSRAIERCDIQFRGNKLLGRVLLERSGEAWQFHWAPGRGLVD